MDPQNRPNNSALTQPLSPLCTYFNNSYKDVLKRPGAAKGQIRYSEIVRIAQMAAASCTSEADQLNDNRRVGYYVDEDGFLRYKPTAAINMSFYQTSAAVGKGGAEGITSRAVKTQAQADIDAAEERIKGELSTFGGGWKSFQEPGLPIEDQPKLKLDRRRRSRNRDGCIVSDAEYEEGRLLSAQKKDEEKKKKDEKREKREKDFRKTWAPLIDKAVESLEKHRSADGVAQLSPLKVGEMKALIVGKTGHLPRAKNNTDGIMKLELSTVIDKPIIVTAPPPSPPAATGAGDDENEDAADDEDADDPMDAERLDFG